MKKILCVVLAVALVLAATTVYAFVQKGDVQAQLEAATVQVAELETAAAGSADLQAQLDEANAKIAELEAAAADADASADLQAQLDEANAKIAELEAAAADTADADRLAELEAAVELYKPYYDDQIAAEFDGGVIFVEEVLEEYAYIESMYAQYGLDLASYGYDVEMKNSSLDMLVESAALDLKAAELGLDQIDDETMAGLTEEAAANMETYIDAVKGQFETEGATEEEVREASLAYLESLEYTEESILQSLVDSYVSEQTYNYITKDVVVTEEDVQAAYDQMVADDQEAYANDYTYTNARSSGTLIAWNPEGYRQVKHVLVKFTDDQAARYDELTDTLDSLNAELEALSAPAGEAAAELSEEDAAAVAAGEAHVHEDGTVHYGDHAEEPAEAAEAEVAEAEVAEEVIARTEEEITSDIAAVEAEIDALYAELMPTAQEVVDKFNQGVSFAELIESYNEDPGMQNEPTKTEGYAVAANSTTWDPAFTEGAMSIAEIGSISEPVRGSYGVHIIYYEADIAAGAVDLETIRSEVEASALDAKLDETYTATVEEWTAAINPVYHYDRLS